VADQFSRSCTARGVITATASGRIEVEVDSVPRCAGCDGACRWYGPAGPRRVTVPTERAFAVGESVSVSVAERDLLRGSAFVYGLPLFAILTGALLGFAALGSDLGTAAGALAGLAAALLAARALRGPLERGARRAVAVTPAE
jgi:positive regulator of sigma E activity